MLSASRLTAMENGRVRLSGTDREVLENPEIGALYLGGTVSAGYPARRAIGLRVPGARADGGAAARWSRP